MSNDLSRIIADIRDRFSVSGVAHHAGVDLKRVGDEWTARCPFHDERTPSFTIYHGDRRWFCFGKCQTGGDVLDFVQSAYGVDLIEAIRILDGNGLHEIQQRRAPAKEQGKKDTTAAANRIVASSVPIGSTPAETYLRSRGITMALPHTLRFARIAAPKGSGVMEANGASLLPVLVAIVTDPSGTLIGIQRTYLTEDGRKASTTDTNGKVKFSLGRIAGGAIQLGPVAPSIVVTEGLEDGLTLAQALGRAVWVAAGASMLSRMVLPEAVRAVVIGADNDEAGERAADAAGRAFYHSGCAVRLMRPNRPFKDFNAELMGACS